jgi:hypothetical protein
VHRAVVVALMVGCAASSPPPKPATVLIENHVRTCTEAAVGLERGTVDVRPPDSSIVEDMRGRCTADSWSVAAIECFADMKPGELGHCAGKLPDSLRDAMFSALAGVGDDRTEIALAGARLETLQVNIAECDRFIGAVRAVIVCNAVPEGTRATLGREVSDFWSLPTHGLPADATRKMAETCTTSLAALQQRAAGCGI